MKKNICPSCGAPYNGKRCRNCYYEHFSEEIAHGNHWHKGEPLVIEAPSRKPIPRANPFGCDRKVRKKRPLLRFFILLTLINSLMPMLRDWGLKLEETEERRSTVTREPVVQADDLLSLHREGDIHIFTSTQDAQNLNDSLTIYVQNDSGKDVTLQSSILLIDNYVVQYGSLYCEAGANAIGKTWLYLDEEELRKAKIQDIRSVSFRFEAYDTNYNSLFSTDLITLGEPSNTFPEFDTNPLYQQDGLRVSYLGYLYSLYHPERFDKGALEFYLENTSEDTLYIACENAAVNGEAANIYLWEELPPGARTIVEGGFYDLDDPEIRSPVNVLLELSLEICRNNDYDSTVHAGPFRFPAAVALDQEDTANG